MGQGGWGGEGRFSLSSSSRQLPCIAYSCSRVSGSEAVRCRSSSDFIHSWYLRMREVGGRLGLRRVDQQHGFRWVRRDRPGCPAPERGKREDQEFEASLSDRRPSLERTSMQALFAERTQSQPVSTTIPNCSKVRV